jgi:hypothetical protein
MNSQLSRATRTALAIVLLLGAQAIGAQEWSQVNGAARDVGVGANGTVWVIGTNPVQGGYGIYRWTGSGWAGIPGGATRIAVDPSGNALVVNNSNNIFRYTGSGWTLLDGAATDIGVGADGSVWVIGTNQVPGGYGIWRRTGNGWTAVPGGAVRITVDAAGKAWVVNNTNNIFRFNGSGWDLLAGSARDIAAGPAGSVWHTATDGGIYRWSGSNWTKQTGGATEIAVAPDGNAWVVNAGGQIFHSKSSQTLAADGAIVVQMTLPQPAQTTTTAPAPLTVVSYTPPPSSGPVCGGIVNGVAQPRCEPTKAEFISKSRNECPSGSFFDLTSWSCWSCPSGFNRSAAPVISEQACSQATSQTLERIRAEFVGARCPAGSFFDPIRGGECWSCPGGYNRSAAHIEAVNACWIPLGENFSRATRNRNTIWPHDCSAGQFHDLWDGGACWSCPAGSRRTAYHVNDGKACVIAVPEQQARAKFEKTAACEAGTIFDPRNGGECWKCPEGALRTVFPVHEASACERPAGVKFASATKSAPLTCEPGDHFDPIDGGSCYRCPTGYDRTASHVKADDACKTDTMQWRSAPYREPGLFRLDGAAEVLRAITEQNVPLVRSSLDLVARHLSAQTGNPVDQVRAEQKRIFINQQQASLVAHAAVYARLMAAIADPTRASIIEKRLVESFRKHVVAKRTHIASDMLNAYNAWKQSDDYWRGQYNLNRGLAGTMYYGTVPPSFDKLGMATTTGIGATATATSIAIEASFEALQFAKAAQRLPILGDLLGVALSAAGAGWTPATSGETIALFAARSAGEIALGQAIGQLLTYAAQIPAWTIVSSGVATSVPMAALSTTGPQIIVAGGMILASIAIDQFIQINEAEPKLRNAVLNAGVDPDLTRMSKTKEGLLQLETYWSYAVGPEVHPGDAFLQFWGPLAITRMAAM